MITARDVCDKIVNTFSSVYKVTHIKVIKKSYGFDCTFKLNGDEEKEFMIKVGLSGNLMETLN